MKLLNILFPHRHKWQTRGQNKWGLPTYRLCLKCRETQCRVNKSYDGITWTPETSVDNSWRAIDYKDGLFVGVSSSGTGNRVFTMQ